MDLKGNAFLYLRNEYIIPLIRYGISRKKVEFWGLKKILTNNIISLNHISKNSIEIEVSEEDFFKSSLCDIELFKNKSIVQYNEFQSINNKRTTWTYVSLYYHFFFAATTLLRMLHRGFIYFDASHVRKIESHFLALYSTTIKLDAGNYFYSTKKHPTSSNLIISLSNKGEGIHQLTWLQLEHVIRYEILPNASGDEIYLYKILLSILSNHDSKFPSILRNNLNYPSESCLLDIENTIQEIDLDSMSNGFDRNISKINLNDNNINNLILFASYYSIIIFNLVQDLYFEYSDRSKGHKDFQIERLRYIMENGVRLIRI